MRPRRLRVVISAGPTREPLDPVRFISNYSTGYMGAVLAAEALKRRHDVTVISGPHSEPYPPGATVIEVERADEMARALRQASQRADLVMMAAAVCDFRPARRRPRKLSRRAALTLHLQAVPDLIGTLPRRPGQIVVGFALETQRVVARARSKLAAKRLDLLLAQQAGPAQAPFGRRPVAAWLVAGQGRVTRLGRVSKPRVARTLLDKAEALWYGQRQATASLKKG